MKGLIEDTTLQGIADAVREKYGTDSTYTPAEIVDAVKGLKTGFFNIQPAKVQYLGAVFPQNSEITIKYEYRSEVPESQWDLERLDFENGLDKILYNAVGMKRVNFDNRILKYVNTFSLASGLCLSDDLLAEKDCLEIVDFSKAGTSSMFSSWTAAFFGRRKLKKIIGAHGSDGDYGVCISSALNTTFKYCESLEELVVMGGVRDGRITGNFYINYSPLLSDESVQSIIDQLSTVKKYKVSFHSDVTAKLTDEQLATIADKGWTLA